MDQFTETAATSALPTLSSNDSATAAVGKESLPTGRADTSGSTAARPVLLPRTAFGARPTASAEDAMVAGWTQDRLPDHVHAACAGRPRFLLHAGPPYANGPMHLGTALTMVLKDLAVRTRRMAGADAVLVPGWDCHGLPVEWKVEEALLARGVRKSDVPVLEFRQACRDWASGWVAKQADGFRRLGVLADWDHAYLTMSPESDATTVGELHKMLRAGLLERALRPVLWSVPERTALADAEVEYKEVAHTSLLVRFPVLEGALAALKGASLVCWTTTPWSLPGNRAVAAAPDVRYVAARVGNVRDESLLVPGEVLVLAESAVDRTLPRCGATTWETVATFTGADLEGTTCAHPLHASGYDYAVPVLAAAFVEASEGTGLVHVAPALGPDDFALARSRGLPVEEVVGEDGRLAAGLPAFGGEAVLNEDGTWGSAGDLVLAALRAAGMLVSSWKARHEAAHSWRSKAPLLYRATPQWFLKVSGDLVGRALDALADVRFLPEVSRQRLEGMLRGRPDWCVSRQRSWGVPLGLFVHRATGEVLTDEDVLERVSQAFAEDGSDAWYARSASWFLGPDRDPADWVQSMDVLDVWFESGVTHKLVVMSRWGADAVADLCLEGSDQHRGWFQSSLLVSVANRGMAPYRALMTHGFVLDGKGRKMAKSEGNVVDPMDVVGQHGADVLRLWVAASDSSVDVRYSEQSLRGHRETLFRFRNTLRWALGNLASASFAPLPRCHWEEPEKWLGARMCQVGAEMRTDAEMFDFPSMVKRLERFCADDLSAFWFNLRKDSLYCDAANSASRRSAASALAVLFDTLAVWLAPFAPFAAEEAWHLRHGPAAPSVHEQVWPDAAPEPGDEDLLRRWKTVRSVRNAVVVSCEPEQKAGRLGSLLDAHVVVTADAATTADLAGVDMACVCGPSAVSVVASADDGVTVQVGCAEGKRCDRCWRRLPEVSAGLCRRCETV